jgi:5'-3' exonuclease
MSKKRVLVIDGTNNFYRSYIVDPSLSTNGAPIGGVKGFFKILQKLCRESKTQKHFQELQGGQKAYSTQQDRQNPNREPGDRKQNLATTEAHRIFK